MRRRGFLAGALAMGATPVSARPVMPLHESPRQLLSPSFVDGSGQERTLEEFRGRTVLLNVWATWCVPCREEMPALDRLQARLGGPGFHVLALSIDRAGMDAVRRFYRDIGIRHLDLYLIEEMKGMLGFGIIGLPTTILIDPRGLEIARRVGPAEWDSAAALSYFQDIIAEGHNSR
ncbi:TlpA family protein disulfide reductase [Tranquillimonas alkanivorans]|uniref:Thiol-disulfide isomerase or thioredoxin n=1 Tax=Tranquillimonas alkanivorans TaxID=441119 RepID=A0A1I5TMS4_9RHOB|nr:TlpA disulfide reductase family protein [Tranquillimonas alkanivorans]SFP84359.1 Thiol-disulfide isomerase or thioredoxin [Tranquillimonas alkanivorans]